MLNSLRELVNRVPGRLEELSKEKVESKPTPSTWSPKEELGHLLDSAANNRQRFVGIVQHKAGSTRVDQALGLSRVLQRRGEQIFDPIRFPFA